ncbi:MAG: hypothetical protein CL878_12795 [Dehalococcoidia bacterium]|nr:hypothetical protein [Dehalococcoidia bacterium]
MTEAQGTPTSDKQPAPRVRFGNTDLHVSRLCQGTAFRHLPRTAVESRGQQVLRHCLEQGVNFFDSAVAYGWGGSEEALGKAIRGHRDRVVVCTKVVPSYAPAREDDAPQPARFTRDFLSQQVEASLRRLGTDYLDLYLLHQPDEGTPAEEIVGAMDALVQSGKIRYWGASNHPAAQVREFVALSTGSGRDSIAGLEEYYTIAGVALSDAGEHRVEQLEREMFPVVRDAGLGLLAFSPLDAGHLVPGRTVEPDSPLAALVQVLDEVAHGLGVSRASVCVAWVLAHQEVTSVLGGAESPEHVDEHLAGTRLVLPADALAALNAASAVYREERVAEVRGE